MNEFTWRKGWDLNSRRLLTSTVFKTVALNHSATLPFGTPAQTRTEMLLALEPKSSVSTDFTTGANWCQQRDSNSRPDVYKTPALSTELCWHCPYFSKEKLGRFLKSAISRASICVSLVVDTKTKEICYRLTRVNSCKTKAFTLETYRRKESVTLFFLMAGAAWVEQTLRPSKSPVLPLDEAPLKWSGKWDLNSRDVLLPRQVVNQAHPLPVI